MPPNLQEVKLKFARRRSAKVMGSLANREAEPQEGEAVRGVMVTNKFRSKVVAPEDLATYTPLRVGLISSKLHVPFVGSAHTLELFLSEMYSGFEKKHMEGSDDGENVIKFILQGDMVRSFI